MKVLIPVDGSECALRAVAHAIRLARSRAEGGEALDLHLLSVQTPLPGSVGMFIGGKDIKDYHRDEGMKALAPARKLLEEAGLAHSIHIDVGSPGELIARYAKDLGVDEIVMGTRGLGNIADAILGSTSEDVLRLSPLPVVLIR